MRANAWTPEEEAWLREVFPHHHNAELAEMHAERFPDRPRRTAAAINSRGQAYGLLKAEGFARNPKTFWTEDRAEWFRSFVPGHTEAEISAEHERLYGTPLTEGQIGGAKHKLGVKSGTHGGRFRKGRAGSFRDEDHRRAFIEAGKATRFKKGIMPPNGIQPIGTERVDRDGYTWVKVASRKRDPRSAHDNWVEKHRLVYEEHNGTIPEGCCVAFADHDKGNFDPANLVAVPRRLWATISRLGVGYHDRETLESCVALAELVQARKRAELRPRVCRDCGAAFAPRFKTQARCEGCIERRKVARR